MKITLVILISSIQICDTNIISGLKIPSSVKGTVFSAAGKFLNGKSRKSNPSTADSPSNLQKKSSKMGQLIDAGTNIAMAVAGAGTLYSALSGDQTPPAVVVSIVNIFSV